MDDKIYYEKVLNRIIQGRLRLRLGDLVLYVYEPSRDVIEESFDIYEEARNKAYFSGCYLREDVLNLLVEQDMWTPRDDKEAEQAGEQIDELKVRAFKSFFKKKELAGIKRSIRRFEMQQAKFLGKKGLLDHLTCDGLANFARKCWILSQTTKTVDGELYDFSKIGVKGLLEIYSENTIPQKDYRRIARENPWRQMWNASKKRGDVFGKASIDLDSQQLNLIAYSQMYDNVYENPDQPSEEIIHDDDCLDGWFIVQKQKYDKERKEQAIDAMLSDKVKNSQEIMVMAQTPEEAKEIYDMNSVHARNKINQRQQQIDNADGNLHFKDLADVKQDRYINAVNTGTQAIKGRG